jgi:predicted amidohydrolase YtcJ
VAIADGKILATGASAAMKKLAGKTAKLIDLVGRTVIPGLTDGHIHGIRAALTFGTEVNWIGVPTLKDALEKIAQAAKARSPDPGSSSPAAGPRSSLPRSAGHTGGSRSSSARQSRLHPASL